VTLFLLDVLTKSIAEIRIVVFIFVVIYKQVNLNATSVITLSVTLQFLYINTINHCHFHIDRSMFIEKS